MGANLTVSSYLLSLRQTNDLGMVTGNVLRTFPLMLSWLLFWLLYSIVLTTCIPSHDTITGAFVAAMLFEVGEKGFALCITIFPSYQLIYGVLAAIPILFVWVYWAWCIVLLDIEMTITLGECRKFKQVAKREGAEQP